MFWQSFCPLWEQHSGTSFGKISAAEISGYPQQLRLLQHIFFGEHPFRELFHDLKPYQNPLGPDFEASEMSGTFWNPTEMLRKLHLEAIRPYMAIPVTRNIPKHCGQHLLTGDFPVANPWSQAAGRRTRCSPRSLAESSCFGTFWNAKVSTNHDTSNRKVVDRWLQHGQQNQGNYNLKCN